MKIIWRAQVARKFILNHIEYIIMFDKAVAGLSKCFSYFLGENVKKKINL